MYFKNMKDQLNITNSEAEPMLSFFFNESALVIKKYNEYMPLDPQTIVEITRWMNRHTAIREGENKSAGVITNIKRCGRDGNFVSYDKPKPRPKEHADLLLDLIKRGPRTSTEIAGEEIEAGQMVEHDSTTGKSAPVIKNPMTYEHAGGIAHGTSANGEGDQEVVLPIPPNGIKVEIPHPSYPILSRGLRSDIKKPFEGFSCADCVCGGDILSRRDCDGAIKTIQCLMDKEMTSVRITHKCGHGYNATIASIDAGKGEQ